MTSPTATLSDQAVAVLAEHYGRTNCAVDRLAGGLTHTTFLICSAGGERAILQRMHPVIGSAVQRDLVRVLDHLEQQGWEMQRIISTKRNELCVQDDEGWVWRLLTYIPGEDADDDACTLAIYYDIGKLLARLHNDLANLQYMPGFVLPHFHDTAHFAWRLRLVADPMTEAGLRTWAATILDAYIHLPELPHDAAQLIHGDPRTNNLLFRNGRPFTFIDFDTVMRGSIWLDIGDLLRSISGNVDQTKQIFSVENSVAVLQGYYAGTQSPLAWPDFLAYSWQAAQLISLELTMRFVTDIVEDSYFGWDATRFASRAEHNLARAQAQWSIYQAYKQEAGKALQSPLAG